MCDYDRHMPRTLAVVCLFLLLAWCVSVSEAHAAPDGEIRFNRDIRPILADHCFRCHGADAGSRQAELRLDERESALAERDGVRIVAPGDPDASELMRRVVAADDAERMPPADHPRLSQAQVDVLRRWIAAGAEYESHWAFIAPQPTALPLVRQRDWLQNPVDAFIMSGIEQHGLHPSAEADRATLIRRLSLDLTGLSPTPAAVDAFITDESPDACEQLVERLLASPRYGERWSLMAAKLRRHRVGSSEVPRFLRIPNRRKAVAFAHRSPRMGFSIRSTENQRSMQDGQQQTAADH